MPNSSPTTSLVGSPGFVPRALCAGIRAYQLVLSPIFGRQCRFYPSCSHYALEALAHHGAGKGLWLTARRIVRCNPLCEGGHDPVPQHY